MEETQQTQAAPASYDAKDIQVLAGLSAVRKLINTVDLYHKIKRKGDLLSLSNELRIKPRTLALAKDEGRILHYFPDLDKSKASVLSRLKTNRELQLFSKNYDIYSCSARTLLKLVLLWNLSVQENPMRFISQEEHDIIVGGLFGDASIRQRDRNSCLRFSHSPNQEKYINWKAEILDNFETSEFRLVQKKIQNRFHNLIAFSTKTHPVFNYYRRLFYENNKKRINAEALKQLNSRSLAVWICDDGSFSRRQNYIILCTNSFNLEEHYLMKRFFAERFGVSPTIGFRDQKYYYLRFRKEDSKKLIEVVRPFIPDCMKYKIGD